jgi:hypothetical protein
MKIKGEEVPWVPDHPKPTPPADPWWMTESECATLIFYWAAEPHPELMDAMLACISRSEQAQQLGTVLRAAGAVLAFEQLDPARAPIWRQNYPDLYRHIEEGMKLPVEFHGWCDYMVVQWMILRRDEIMMQLLERAGAWGEKDKYTAKAITKYAREHGPFRAAAERLKIPTLVQTVD